jgi:SAM-dependent methyltransferase
MKVFDSAVGVATSQQAMEDTLAEYQATLRRGGDSSLSVMKTLGKVWAQYYDSHMITHEAAVRALERQLVALNMSGVGSYDSPIIGRRILESTCGTGTVIKGLYDAMPEVRAGNYQITANDISPDMKMIAKQKVRGICNEFTSEDIRNMRFGNRRFDTIIWSQTLHLVVDQKIFVREMDPNHPAEKTDHRQMKIRVLQKLFDLIPWGGHFVLIDEWPAKFTPTYTNPLETMVSRLFSYTFRPIADLSTFRDDMMRKVNGARLVTECKARIDEDHSMYMFVYAKDLDDANKSPVLPRSQGPLSKPAWADLTRIRDEVRKRIIQGFAMVDAPFREHLVNRQGHDFLPVDGGDVFDATGYDANRIECTLGRRGKCGTIILPDILHKLSDERRRAVIRTAIGSLRDGGSLMLIDEWPFSKDSSVDPHGLHKTELRRMMKDFDAQLGFEATLRERIMEGYDSGVYGFLFRKKS